MRIARTGVELRETLQAERISGRTIGFVPTMGALHEGHLSLVRLARAKDEAVVVSVFVNPLQFGQAEDLEAYPRDPERDFELLEGEGTDVAFLPSVDEMYPAGDCTTISVGRPLGRVLEGHDRPGHFDGVCTVVAKLFNLVEPDHAFFGQKDAQQVAVIRRMVHDLKFPIDVVVGPTVRDPDGLALSSRNCFLSPEDRTKALALSRALNAGAAELSAGGAVEVVEKVMWDLLAAGEGVEPSYARVVDRHSFEVPEGDTGMVLVVAARVGGVRLIDNVEVKS